MTASCNVSILLAPARRATADVRGPAGGRDDIECKITVDGKELRYISNDEIGDFERDAIRDLNQWIPDLVPYFDGVEFKVIELDDISADDIGQQTLRPVNRLGSVRRHESQPRRDDPRRPAHRCDDGHVAQVTVTTWNEQF